MPQVDCTEDATAAILCMEAIAIAADNNPWIGVGRAVGSTVAGSIVAAEALGHIVDCPCFVPVDNTAVVAIVDNLCFGAADSNTVVVVDILCTEAVEATGDRPDNKTADKRFHNLENAFETLNIRYNKDTSKCENFWLEMSKG